MAEWRFGRGWNDEELTVRLAEAAQLARNFDVGAENHVVRGREAHATEIDAERNLCRRVAYRSERGDGVDIELRRVGCQNGVGFGNGVNLAKQALLDFQTLEGGLKNQVGRFLVDEDHLPLQKPAGGVLVCPADEGKRSYSMNAWANSRLD